MRIVIDTEVKTLATGDGEAIDLHGREAFELISNLWLKTSWNQKYSYTFTWMGRRIIQHPEDIVRLQEVIYSLKPDLIIETGGIPRRPISLREPAKQFGRTTRCLSF
jgi:cephalosporin hydroxylase